MGKTAFEKFQKTIMGEDPIDFSVKAPVATPSEKPSVRKEAEAGKRKSPDVKKEDAEKPYQINVHVSYDTRYKINEIKFRTGLSIKEVIAEAIADYYQKKIEAKG